MDADKYIRYRYELKVSFFSIWKICVSDKVPVEMVNGKKMKTLPCYGGYECSGFLSLFNIAINFCFTFSLLCWKGYVSKDGWRIFYTAMAFIFSHILLVFTTFFSREIVEECIKHKKKECFECIKMYGFFDEDYKKFELCSDHEGKLPYQSLVPTNNCEKCVGINVRWVSNM